MKAQKKQQYEKHNHGNRSTGKLKENNSGTGIFFKNGEFFFFVLGEKILEMWEDKFDYVQVKARTRNPDKLGKRFDGEILGYIEKDEKKVKVVLLFGVSDEDLCYDEHNDVMDGLDYERQFVLPRTEFDIFIDALKRLKDRKK